MPALSVCPSIHLFVCLSVCFCACLPACLSGPSLGDLSDKKRGKFGWFSHSNETHGETLFSITSVFFCHFHEPFYTLCVCVWVSVWSLLFLSKCGKSVCDIVSLINIWDSVLRIFWPCYNSPGFTIFTVSLPSVLFEGIFCQFKSKFKIYFTHTTRRKILSPE